MIFGVSRAVELAQRIRTIVSNLPALAIGEEDDSVVLNMPNLLDPGKA